MKCLNRLGSVSTEKLDIFHGSSMKFSPGDFSDADFLSKHFCKNEIDFSHAEVYVCS